jgi:hypothetical protein
MCSFTVRAVPLFVHVLVLPALSLLSSGCNSTRVFHADFDSDTVGQPPSPTQSVGTVWVEPTDGTVNVIASPLPDLPRTKWIDLGIPATRPRAALKGEFASVHDGGDYTLVAYLFIRDGTSAVTVQFEPAGQEPNDYANFLHLDFMPEGDVRIDDGVRFGHYPRDEIFGLRVNLVIDDSSAAAHISLFGAGASGDADVSLQPAMLASARRFAAVRFWLLFGLQGQFFVDNIDVVRRNE